jgi:hypothetical protein
MKITNKYNLPVALLNAMSKDGYSKGKSDYSVTGLLTPPKVALLREQYDSEMEMDISEKMFTFLGTALHDVLEKTLMPENCIHEERLFASIDGTTISGAIDVQEKTPAGTVIWDYKVTSVWSVMNSREEWAQQLNMYKWFVETVKKERVIALKICAFLRDWSNNGRGENYPEASIVVIDIPIWSAVEAETFIRGRLNAHQQARMLSDFGDELPACSDAERWMSETTFAVKREGRKTAIRVLTDADEAKEMAVKENGYVEVRLGEPRRCAGNYCGVATWCKQYQGEKNESN